MKIEVDEGSTSVQGAVIIVMPVAFRCRNLYSDASGNY